MAYENLHLGRSPMTDHVYVGRLSKDKGRWIDKRDMTNQFIDCVIGRWNGYVETINSGDGKIYEISVKEVTK